MRAPGHPKCLIFPLHFPRSRRIIFPYSHAAVAEWQTRYFEGVVIVRSCEFKSHRPHQRAVKNAFVFFTALFIFRLCVIYPAGGMAPAGAEAFSSLCIERHLSYVHFFLPWGRKKRTKERSHRPVEICLSSGAVGCSAVNAFAVRADSYSDIYPSVPLTAARRIRPPLRLARFQGAQSANF